MKRNRVDFTLRDLFEFLLASPVITPIFILAVIMDRLNIKIRSG